MLLADTNHKPLNPKKMLDNKTKERIAQEAEGKYPTKYTKHRQRLNRLHNQAGYIAGAEAEATRAQELIEAYRELHSLSNDQLNEMENHVKDYEPDREKVARAYELLKTIKALTNYNNPVNK